MHNYTHGKLPFSYNETWITNRMRNLNIDLRNADNLYIPAHNIASVKRFSLFNFPKIWNEAPDIKNNPSLSVFQKYINSAMLNVNRLVYVFFPLRAD
jgi:hypothetical protein